MRRERCHEAILRGAEFRVARLNVRVWEWRARTAKVGNRVVRCSICAHVEHTAGWPSGLRVLVIILIGWHYTLYWHVY